MDNFVHFPRLNDSVGVITSLLPSSDAYFVRIGSFPATEEAIPPWSLWDSGGGLLLSSLYILPSRSDGRVTREGLGRYDRE